MNAARFRAWQRTRERREGGSLVRWLAPLVGGAGLAAIVYARAQTNLTSASHLWLAGTCVAFALAFMRVPFQIYWRKDAALLAQLPLDGAVLWTAAVARCIRAALATFLVPIVGAVPFALADPWRVNELTRTLQAMPIAGDPVPHLTPLELALRHVGLAGAFVLVAAALIPAVTMWAASIVAQSKDLLHVATAVGGAPARKQDHLRAPGTGSAGAMLGAIPGFVSSVVFVLVIVMSPWVLNHDASLDPMTGFIIFAATSLVPLLAQRAGMAQRMGDILRDVSALDRQRLATLEIQPPTAIERLVMKLVGDAGLAYSKDARLMRRRYPMAFALGALIFIVLAIIGIARPDDPTWLIATAIGAALYAIVLLRRLGQPPIELERLSSTLPLAHLRRAKVAWLAAWVCVYVAVPGVFALLR
ncbi:MAG TPA: hypothetical protein VGC41_21435 [Kofleriaceae bacterium]